MKSNDTINYLKNLFGKRTIWENRYVSLHNSKLFIYKDQKYNKPLMAFDLTKEVIIKEVRKQDINGKENVIQLIFSKGGSTHFFATATYQSYTKWLKAFEHIKDANKIS